RLFAATHLCVTVISANRLSPTMPVPHPFHESRNRVARRAESLGRVGLAALCEPPHGSPQSARANEIEIVCCETSEPKMSRYKAIATSDAWKSRVGTTNTWPVSLQAVRKMRHSVLQPSSQRDTQGYAARYYPAQTSWPSP